MRCRRWTVPIAAAATFLMLPTSSAAHGLSQGPPATDLGGIVTAWHLDVPMILGLSLAAAAYIAAVRSVDAAHSSNRWPKRRTAAFLVALLALVVALLSPVDTLADDLLTIHMGQHLLLVSVAAPLLAASGIGTLALRTANADSRNRVLLPILHGRVISALTFPAVGWVAFAAVMWGTHFSSLYNAALLDDGLHAVEHLLYLAAAMLFWWPLLSPDPMRWRLHPGAKIMALLAQMPSMSLLAVAIVGASSPLYAAYLGRSEAFGLDALEDQRLAGSIMWLLGDASFLIPAAFLLLVLVRHEEAETKRVDARLDRARAIAARKET